MKKSSSPTLEQFEDLLNWLDSDRERAGMRYEEIRRSLIVIFIWRGCNTAEDLADETINRVTRKVTELKGTYEGDPARYFYGVAKNILAEYRRAQPSRVPQNLVNDSNYEAYEKELLLEVLEECLNTLSKEDRALILSYYEGTKQAKIDHRKALAKKFNLSESTLRKRVQRLRSKLSRCFQERLKGFMKSVDDSD